MTTLVLGASPNPSRYAYTAVQRLVTHGYEVYPFGIRQGLIGDLDIKHTWPVPESIHTISVYLSPHLQAQYFDKIRDLKPKRIILNPGTENSQIKSVAQEIGSEILEACTLVMLNTGQYESAVNM